MRYLFVPTIALVLLSAFTGSGYADIYGWRYAGPGVSGSGVLTTTVFPSGLTQVTSISGTANGQPIVGLSAYDEPDDLLFPAFPSPNPIVSPDGISFSVGDGSMSFNIESIGFINCDGAEYCLIGPDGTSNVNGPPTPGTSIIGLSSFTVTSVPEVSAWMMMLVGFIGLGWSAGAHRAGVLKPGAEGVLRLNKARETASGIGKCARNSFAIDPPTAV